MMKAKSLPLVYSCSGCSNVAQLANDVALHIDQSGRAEMSCIAGVGGGVPALVKIARSGRPVIAIDGCQLHCAEACLKNANVNPDHHIRLYDLDYKKRKKQKASQAQFIEVVELLENLLPQ
ncbi:putative zinc-binding protein [Amphritea sp. HPY]|uniref:putative zinc-binding protein n=1 Tax=Amphritea sp. HPY TaxID=3421652 RepID=UPI003D7D3971